MEAKNEVQGDDGLRGSGERGKKKGVHVVSVLSSSAMTAKYDEEGTATARGIERGSIAPLVPPPKNKPSVFAHGAPSAFSFWKPKKLHL